MPVPAWIENLYAKTPLWARRAAYLARTPPGHYYSPYPKLSEIAARADEMWAPFVSAPGIDLREQHQWELLSELAPLAKQLPFVAGGSGRYRSDNRPYVIGDALILGSMLTSLKPRRYVEVGSGWSTAVALDARDIAGDGFEVVCIDPYPDRLNEMLGGAHPDGFSLRAEAVQDTPDTVFTSLESGDVLVIDSTHVVRAGSDVNHLVFNVLPLLAPGVAVHIHDIFVGFEYPRKWVEERRAWSEAYLLRAFLQFNTAFEITLFTAMLQQRDLDRYLELLPAAAPNPGAQLWLTRTS